MRHLAAGLFVIALVGAACSGGSGTPATSANETPVVGGAVTYAYYQKAAPALNAISVAGVGAQAGALLQAHVYDTLYRSTQDGGVEDSLAEKTTISADALQWTLTMRTGVKFHDGTPLDAAAVKTNFDLRKTSATFSSKSLLAAVKEVRTVDSRTLQLVLTSPFASLRTVLSAPQFGIQSPSAMSKYGDAEYWKHAAGTGPFMVDGTPSEQSVTLLRNPDYWGSKAYLDKVEIRWISDQAASLLALEAGNVQMTSLPIEDFSRVQKAGKFAVWPSEGVGPAGIPQRLYFNTSKAPFNDQRVRQAVVYGTNRDAYLPLYGGLAEPAFSLVPPGVFGYAKQAPYPYDVTKAKQLLAAAGVAQGTEIRLISPTSPASFPVTAQALQQDLEKLGFKVNLRVIETTPWIAEAAAPAAESTWHIGWQGGSIPYNDSEAFFGKFLYGPNDAPKGGNWVHYKNPQLDKLYEDQQKLIDPVQRAKILGDMQKLVWEDAPMFATAVAATEAVASSKKLRGLEFLPGGTAPIFWKAWLSE